MAGPGSSKETRVVELVLKATGDAELKRMTTELTAMRASAEKSQKSLDGMEESGRKLGNTIRLLTTAAFGRSALGVFGQFTDQITKAATAIGDMDDAAGGASKQFAQYSKAAQEYNNTIADIEKTFGDVVKGITAGMLPAMIALAKTFDASIKSGTDFVAVGKAIGDVLVTVTSWVAQAIKAFTEFFKILDLALKAKNDFAMGMETSLSDHASSAKWFEAAGNEALAATTRTKAYLNTVNAVGAAIKNNYQIAQQRTGKGTAAPSDAGGGGRSGKTASGKEPLTQLEEFTKANANLNDQIMRGNQAMQSQLDSAAKLADQYNRAVDPLIAYNEGLAKLAEANKLGQVTDAAAAAEKARLNKVLADQNEALLENSKAWKDHQKEIDKQKQAAEDLQKTWGFVADAMGEAAYSIIAGTESIGRAVRRMVATIISEVFRLEAIKLANQLISKLLPDFHIGAKNAQGNAYVGGRLQAFAQGGVINSPTMFGYGGGIGIAGEAGTEVIAPLKRDASGNMGVGAVAPKVTVNNYAGADVAVRQTDQGVQIDVLRRQIADDIRRGGNPVSAAMESTYRVGRYAGAYG